MSVYRHTGLSKEQITKRRYVQKAATDRGIEAKEVDWIWSLAIIAVLLVLDILLIGHSYGLLRFPGEMGPVDFAKNGAIAFMDFYEDSLKRSNDVAFGAASYIMNIYKEEILLSKSREDVGNLMANMILDTYQEVDREHLRRAEARVLELLSSDNNITRNPNANGTIVITVINGSLELVDRFNLVRKDMRSRLSVDEVILSCPPYPIEIIVEGGAVSLSPPDLENRINAMTKEIELLRETSQEIGEASGALEISGKGIEIYAYDAKEGYTWAEVVHESDIKNIVDILMSEDAIGVQIGNERIVANTSIRCIGPIILVNQNPVAVNPIKITALGDSKKLQKALSSIQKEFENTGKKLEIIENDEISLVAYRKG